MATFFLIIIYLAFISLGLPDSLLGVAWPLMQSEYSAPFATAGLISMLIAGGTIVSSLASGAVHKRLSAGLITLLSCLMTTVSLLGFAWAPALIWLFFLAIPLGLGAGSVDAALNNFVATHYRARHMSWLHCFWGIGATLGPLIMSRYIAGHNSWRHGYLAVAAIQSGLVALLFVTLPLWRSMTQKFAGHPVAPAGGGQNLPTGLPHEAAQKVRPLQIKGVKLALVTFLFYCSAETTMGLWGSSFLVDIKGLPAAMAARWVSLFYAGITIGRLITGFITFKVSNRVLIRMGQSVALVGAAILVLPLPTILALIGFLLVGLGCAPIFPCMLHETPTRFGRENSQTLMGYQMALAYTGSTFLPPLLGLVAAYATIGLFPFFILAYILILIVGSEKINLLMKNDK
jgi:fucose permease